MSRFTVAVIACGIAAARAASTTECDSAFTVGSISASTTQEKCSAINAFAECLETATSGSPSPSSDALLAAALSANGGCVKPSVKPSLHAQGGSLTANVDAAGDFCIERPGMIPACVGNLVQTVTELSDDVTTQLASADAKTSAALTAAAAALEVQTIQIGENVDTSLAAMENKLDATSTTLDAKIDVTDAKITAFGATYGQATTDKLAALDTKLTARIVALEKGAQCNFRGTHDGTKCVCIKGWAGASCDTATYATCVDAGTNGVTLLEGGVSTYCYEGWELAFNLATDQAPAQEFRAKFWTEEGKTLNTPTLTKDCKTGTFNTKKDHEKIMIMAHNKGKVIGTSVYTIKAGKGETLQNIFKTKKNFAYTNTRSEHTGQLKNQLRHNPNRPQSLYGDLFMDYSHALVINREGGWSAQVNQNRIATTLSNSNYPHTFAGLGGHHYQGNDWYTYYEAAPITSYCSAVRGYGSNAVMTGNVEKSGYRNSCRWSFSWVKTDFAIFIK